MSRAGLARAAGLHANTLRDCTEDGWNPTTETLGKIERFLAENDETPVLVPIEEIIDEARNGRMFILVDDEDRENEGDLFLAAEKVTPAAVNFMATHARGLICLALTKERSDSLGLQQMTNHNRSRNETAFTASIEALSATTNSSALWKRSSGLRASARCTTSSISGQSSGR